MSNTHPHPFGLAAATALSSLSSEERADFYQRLAIEDHDVNHLLDALIARMRCDDDETLARTLQVHRRIIEMLRDGKLGLSPPMLMLIERTAGMDPQELHDLIIDSGARRPEPHPALRRLR